MLLEAAGIKKIFGKLAGLSVVILGAGEMAELTGVHLRSQQVKQITIASRTFASAEQLAQQLGGVAVPWRDMVSARAAVALAGSHPDIFASVGIHPHDVARMAEPDWAELEQLARRDRVVGVG